MTEFSKLVQSFGGSMDQLTRELNSPKSKDADNLDLVWENQTILFLFGVILKMILIPNTRTILEKIWGKRK